MTTPQINCTFQELPADDIAPFLPKAREGANSYTSTFLAAVAQMLLTNYPNGFTINEAFQVSQSADLPYAETAKLFRSWTTKLLASGRLRAIEGAYDDTVFVVV